MNGFLQVFIITFVAVFLTCLGAPLAEAFDAPKSGFLLTTPSRGMISEVNREGEPSLAGIFNVGGLSTNTLVSPVRSLTYMADCLLNGDPYSCEYSNLE